MRFIPLLAAVFLWFVPEAKAHEFWIEPVEYQPPVEGRLEAGLVNGERFGAPDMTRLQIAYIPRWFTRFDVVLGDQTEPAKGRMGDTPALDMDTLGEGLTIAVYQSSGDFLTYDAWEKFTSFATHKGFPEVIARHRARGLPEDGVREYYTRFSKSLIGVGHGAGSDRRIGLETEIVALDNPYTDDLQGKMRVQLFYGAAPRSDVQVELFEKDAAGEVEVTLHRTDAEGVAVLPVRRGYSYMADADVIREPGKVLGDQGVMWESLWANMTFAVPQ